MASTKLTALTVAVPISTDIIYFVSDPGGAPVSKKAMVSNFVLASSLGANVATALAVALNSAGGLAPVSSPTLVTPVLGTASYTSLMGGNIGRGAGAFEYGFDWRPSSGIAQNKTVIIQDATPTTGSTTLRLDEGPGQSGLDFAIYSYAGSARMVFHSDSYLAVSTPFGSSGIRVNNSFFATNSMFSIAGPIPLAFTSSSDAENGQDTGLSRISAGLVGVGTGTQGSFAGDIKATRFIANSVVRFKGYTVATLPAGTAGDNAYVTDAIAPTFLATVVGGGAIVTPVFYNGSAWVGA